MSELTAERLSIYEKGRQLSYDLRRSDRKTLAISVYPDGRVVVIAPHHTELHQIEAKIGKRFGWIERSQREFEQLPQAPSDRQWVAGETHLYLGRQYQLKVEIGEPISAKLQGSCFHVLVPNQKDPDSIRAVMESWYRDRANYIFKQRLNRCLRTSKPFLGLDRVNPIVRKMKNRWGSCTPTGRIILNLDLIQVPIQCIDYIIMHELCHLAVMNHSSKFWQLLSQCMPDWEKRRQTLSRIEI
jgi:predicted metal-dependent hydrolase